jgi:hypothetical protein
MMSDISAFQELVGQDVGRSSPYLKPGTKVTVITMEKPWGTLYHLKTYVS